MKRYVHAASDVYELANSKDVLVRCQVAHDPSTPAEVLAQLANDENEDVRREVANNSSVSVELLAQLANDEDDIVRWEVARTPSTPADILAQLASDTDKWVRCGVAENPSTPVEILTQLVKDEDKDVRLRVAQNRLTPSEVLAQLTNDTDKWVRKYAQKQLNAILDPNPEKSKSTKWVSIINQLDGDAEICDPFYEQTEAAEYVESLQYQVENNLGVWLEPSVQGGQGGVWIYENGTDDTLAEDIDYESFNSDVLSLVLQSKSEAQFKKAYKTYLENLINQYSNEEVKS